MALPSRRGASHVRLERTNQYSVAGGAPDRRAGDAPRRSRLREVHILLRMVLSPQRGAHVPYLRGDEHHLGSTKLSSRMRAVHILKNELSLACGAHFYAHL